MANPPPPKTTEEVRSPREKLIAAYDLLAELVADSNEQPPPALAQPSDTAAQDAALGLLRTVSDAHAADAVALRAQLAAVTRERDEAQKLADARLLWQAEADTLRATLSEREKTLAEVREAVRQWFGGAVPLKIAERFALTPQPPPESHEKEK